MTSFSFEPVAKGGGVIDIIFIHGLSGDPKATWTCATPADPADAYWPVWIAQELPQANVYTLGYPAGLVENWIEASMSLFERAKGVLEYLAAHGLGCRPIAIVAHSLGGLLAKQIIRTGREVDDIAWNEIAAQCRLVAFLATPHNGSALASVLKFALSKLAPKHVEALTSGNAYLDELKQAYRTAAGTAGIKTIVYYEKYKTKGVLVVDRTSADPGVSGVNPLAVDADHATICKPASREAFVHMTLMRQLRDLVAQCEAAATPPAGEVPFAFAGECYSEKTSDRRDLLTKLTDAQREHEYHFANEAQNRFAQSYHRLGLHASARAVNDNLLSDIQQRFETHVYLAQICKGSADTAITAALQADVIDPIVVKYGAKHNVSARTVLDALYYLTEQCHIRWDAA